MRDADTVAVSTAELRVATGRGGARANGSIPAPLVLGGGAAVEGAQVVVLTADGSGKLGPAGHEVLRTIPLGGFRTGEWRAPFARLVERTLRAPEPEGRGLNDAQVKIVKDCLKSLASSRE